MKRPEFVDFVTPMISRKSVAQTRITAHVNDEHPANFIKKGLLLIPAIFDTFASSLLGLRNARDFVQ